MPLDNITDVGQQIWVKIGGKNRNEKLPKFARLMASKHSVPQTRPREICLWQGREQTANPKKAPLTCDDAADTRLPRYIQRRSSWSR